MSSPLLIPVEVKARELFARVGLGARALKRGWPVLIGVSSDLHKNPSAFPLGLVAENEITPGGARFMGLAGPMGFGFVAWDEEGIIPINDDAYVQLRIDPVNLAGVQRLFTRGAGDTAAIAARFPEHAEKLTPAGNPRLEILRPDLLPHQTVDEPRRRPVILVTSRFSRANPFAISREKARANVMTKFRVEEGSQLWHTVNAWLDHVTVAFDRFHEIVSRIPAAFPGHDVVIRPHPSEGVAAWKRIADAHPNCTCSTDGTATDQMLKADMLVVHSSCTTAIEAALVGLPVLSVTPNSDPRFDAAITHRISERHDTADSLIEGIRAARLGDRAAIAARAARVRERLDGHIAGLGARGTCDIILDAIEKDGWEPPARTSAMRRAGLVDRRARLARQVRDGIAMLKPAERKRAEVRKAYKEQKFPHTTTGEIEALLARFGVHDARVRPFREQWWSIEPA